MHLFVLFLGLLLDLSLLAFAAECSLRATGSALGTSLSDLGQLLGI